MKTCLAISTKGEHAHILWPRNSIPSRYLTDMHTYVHKNIINTSVYIPALFITGNNPKCLTRVEWVIYCDIVLPWNIMQQWKQWIPVIQEYGYIFNTIIWLNLIDNGNKRNYTQQDTFCEIQFFKDPKEVTRMTCTIWEI